MKNKPKDGMKLHHWIALGGKPEDFEGAKESASEERAEKKKGKEK